MWDIAFPGTVLLLKLVFKTVIEQQMKPVDVAKAMLAFPIDIAFLAFSFGAAILYSRPPAQIANGTLRDMFIAIVAAIILLASTTAFSKKSGEAFTRERFVMTFVHIIPAYALSLLTLWAALHAAEII
jgi:hypothetical protein